MGSSKSNRDRESSQESWKSVAAFKCFTQGQEENMSGFLTNQRHNFRACVLIISSEEYATVCTVVILTWKREHCCDIPVSMLCLRILPGSQTKKKANSCTVSVLVGQCLSHPHMHSSDSPPGVSRLWGGNSSGRMLTNNSFLLMCYSCINSIFFI